MTVTAIALLMQAMIGHVAWLILVLWGREASCTQPLVVAVVVAVAAPGRVLALGQASTSASALVPAWASAPASASAALASAPAVPAAVHNEAAAAAAAAVVPAARHDNTRKHPKPPRHLLPPSTAAVLHSASRGHAQDRERRGTKIAPSALLFEKEKGRATAGQRTRSSEPSGFGLPFAKRLFS